MSCSIQAPGDPRAKTLNAKRKKPSTVPGRTRPMNSSVLPKPAKDLYQYPCHAVDPCARLNPGRRQDAIITCRLRFLRTSITNLALPEFTSHGIVHRPRFGVSRDRPSLSHRMQPCGIYGKKPCNTWLDWQKMSRYSSMFTRSRPPLTDLPTSAIWSRPWFVQCSISFLPLNLFARGMQR